MDERAALVALTMVEGLGPARLRRLERYFHSAAAAWAQRARWCSVKGFSDRLVRRALGITEHDVERQLQRMERLGVRMVTDDDPEYPADLLHLANPPRVLFVRGQPLPRRSSQCVAIVGTRRPTPTGEEVAYQLARDLAAIGFVVVSGLARGIDGAAHAGALRGGSTVAVLGCGLDVPYPPEHAELMEQIARAGTLVSEYPLGTPPLRSHFPVRNRIVAALSQGVILVECGPSSGAMYTVDIALDLGREVMAVPGDVTKWQSHGPNDLIRQGATLIRHAADVLLALGRTMPPAALATPREEAAAHDGSERAVRDGAATVLRCLVDQGPASVDELSAALDMPAADVAAAVAWMELLGQVRRAPGGRFVAVR